MRDVFAVADVLVSHAVRDHGEEVDIIGYYGSHAQGTATARSDLDIFYIPADGKTPPISRTFLVDGVLLDFWGIIWETMEGFATGRIRGWAFAPALVHHAKVLHARSEEQLERLNKLKQRILDLQVPASQPEMVRRAVAAFSKVMAHAGTLRLAAADGGLADARHAGWQVIQSAWECLALANQTFFDRGLRGSLDQLDKLQHKPSDMKETIVAISTSQDPSQILSSCDQLVLGTRQILREFQRAVPGRATARDAFRDAYPEIKDMIEKVLSSCQQRQPVAASAAAWLLQTDVSCMLEATKAGAANTDFNLCGELTAGYRELGLPDLMEIPPEELDELAQQTQALDARLREWLREQSVDLNEFASLEDFKRSL